MNKFLAGFMALAAVLGAGAIFLQHQAIGQLREEITMLRTEVQRPAKLGKDAAAAPRPQERAVVATESPRVDEQRAELTKLRAEVKALAASTQEIARVVQAAQQGAKVDSSIPVKITPVAELRNAGKATAVAAIETLLWAAAGGDVETVAGTILLEPAALAKAQEFFVRLPDATRAQYGSPDRLVALMIARDAAVLTGMQILGQRDVTPEIVGVRVRIANGEAKTKEQNFSLQKTADGLRLKVPDDAVEKYMRQLSGGK